MALSPDDIIAERAREFPEAKLRELLQNAEKAIDAQIRQKYKTGEESCYVVIPTSLLPESVCDSLRTLYCGPGRWARMEIQMRRYDIQSTDIFLYRKPAAWSS